MNLEQTHRQFNLSVIERYNRRCRRIVALFTAGRKVTDNIILYKTSMMRIGYDAAMKELTN